MTRHLTHLATRLPAVRAAIERAAWKAAHDIARRVANAPWHQAARRRTLSIRARLVINDDRRRDAAAAVREARRGT